MSSPSKVLARKWRPKSFTDLFGQDHVVQALRRALTEKRLHHAYLFTGTRGVGKTTISRILAKSLNCEQGTSATPCGQCSTCRQIDEGRFVDYLELDAASNRGVEDITQLLQQAVFMPSVARYKVFMIDEVHMLSTHAFNAMLKTLEEPPEHMKFILATTDAQKIPLTVLSRCMQFGLKPIPERLIIQQLQLILTSEAVTAEPEALQLIARSARGSMRDALSILDQAISYCGKSIDTTQTQQMLGTVDRNLLIPLIEALADNNAVLMLELAEQMHTMGFSCAQVLQECAHFLQQIAVMQIAPSALDKNHENYEVLSKLAKQMSAEHVQACFSIVLHGQTELNLCSDEFTSFSMTLLRLLAFRPVPNPNPPASSALKRSDSIARLNLKLDAFLQNNSNQTATNALSQMSVTLHADTLARAEDVQRMQAAYSPDRNHTTQAHLTEALMDEPTSSAVLSSLDKAQHWYSVIPALTLDSRTLAAARISEFIKVENSVTADESRLSTLYLRISDEKFIDTSTEESIAQALTHYFARPWKVELTHGAVNDNFDRQEKIRQQAILKPLKEVVLQNKVAQLLLQHYGATLDETSLLESSQQQHRTKN